MATLRIEVVYALRDAAHTCWVELAPGSNVSDAVSASGLLADGCVPEAAAFGIHGRRVPLQHVVRAGDRVEIYRPLKSDPASARRTRVGRSKISRRTTR